MNSTRSLTLRAKAIARVDLDFCAMYKRTTFNFDLHRQPHAYGFIVERKGETQAADGSPLRVMPPVGEPGREGAGL